MKIFKIIFDILIYIFSILGGLSSIYVFYRWLSQNKKITWKKVQTGILKLKDKLIHDKYYPTLIIGIGRGGAVISALLSGTLGNIPIIVIDRAYNWQEKNRKEVLCEELRINNNLKYVLLVAGELHSGNTAKLYYNYFKKMGATNIKMLAFMKEPYPTFQPDYYYIKTDKSNIRFPWMLTKDYKRESRINYSEK